MKQYKKPIKSSIYSLAIGNPATLKRKNRTSHVTAPLVLDLSPAPLCTRTLQWMGGGEGCGLHKILKLDNQPGPLKAKVHTSRTKQMVLVFFDAKGIIYMNFVLKGKLLMPPTSRLPWPDFSKFSNRRGPSWRCRSGDCIGTMPRSMPPPLWWTSWWRRA